MSIPKSLAANGNIGAVVGDVITDIG